LNKHNLKQISEMDEEGLYTFREAANICGVSYATARSWVIRKKIVNCVKMAGTHYVLGQDIKKMLHLKCNI